MQHISLKTLSPTSTTRILTTPRSTLPEISYPIQVICAPTSLFAYTLSSSRRPSTRSFSSSPLVSHANRTTVCASSSRVDTSIPESMEQAINQAAFTIYSHLNSPQKPKLAIEIPVPDTSETAALSLTNQVVSSLSSYQNKNKNSQQQQFAIGTVHSLLNDLAAIKNKNLCVIIPEIRDIPALEKLLSSWYGSTVVLINAEWMPSSGEEDFGVPSEYTAFARSFETVYSFFPIEAKAFGIVTQEGALFRMLVGGGDSSTWDDIISGKGLAKKAAKKKNVSNSTSRNAGFANTTTTTTSSPSSMKNNNSEMTNAWSIYIRDKESWEPVGRMQKRPSSVEVEVAFYNAGAANSPLTKGAKFLKNIVGKKK